MEYKKCHYIKLFDSGVIIHADEWSDGTPFTDYGELDFFYVEFLSNYEEIKKFDNGECCFENIKITKNLSEHSYLHQIKEIEVLDKGNILNIIIYFKDDPEPLKYTYNGKYEICWK